ncbi:hypothetical protein Hanom_Chr12g01121151 [Helianthus anomalus]
MECTQSSIVTKLQVVTTALEELKEERSSKKLCLLEAKRLGADVKELEVEWGTLESEIDLLEHTANVLRMNLVQPQLPVVEPQTCEGKTPLKKPLTP